MRRMLISLALLKENERLKLNINATEEYVIVKAHGYREPVARVAQALAWLSAAVRDTLSEALAYSDVTISRNFDILVIRPSELQPFAQGGKSCWHSLFVRMVIAKGNFGRARRFGYGLEIDFSIMVHLAAVIHPVKYNGGIVLLGYSTLLFPTKHHEDGSYQWHLETSRDCQIKLSTMNKKEWFKINEDIAERELNNSVNLAGTKAFLGWCQVSKINLSMTELDPNIPSSTVQEVGRKLEWDSVSLATSIGLHAGLANIAPSLSGTWKVKKNSYSHTRESNFGKIISEAKKDPLLLFDTSNRRGWLVPKLCAILYMAHVYLRDARLQPPFLKALPHWDGGEEAYNVFLHNGSEPMDPKQNCLEKDNAFLLRNFVEDRWLYMVFAGEELKPRGSTNSLEGLNLKDIALSKSGTHLLQQKLNNSDHSWDKFLGRIDMVLFCGAVGEVIAPSPETQPCQCFGVPKGKDCLAASLECLQRLAGGAPNSAAFEEMFPGLSCYRWDPAFKDCSTAKTTAWSTCIHSRVQYLRKNNKGEAEGEDESEDEEGEFGKFCSEGAVIIGRRSPKKIRKENPSNKRNHDKEGIITKMELLLTNKGKVRP
jgi:hypothetical protein